MAAVMSIQTTLHIKTGGGGGGGVNMLTSQ